MKIGKAMKKLKFWSKKMKKKKIKVIEHCQHCHCSSQSYQPSAPPLPPWLDYNHSHESDQKHEEISPFSATHSSSRGQFAPQEIVSEPNSPYQALPVSNNSYQQYMAPNPVYGFPVVPEARTERTAGTFGCVMDFGIHLFRCFCPCLRVREVY